jgi:hypothetical protein
MALTAATMAASFAFERGARSASAAELGLSGWFTIPSFTN